MEYVQRIRKLIGHESLLLVGAAVLVLQEGRLLMMRRTDNGGWGIPGGVLERGERLEETARRYGWCWSGQSIFKKRSCRD